LETLGANVLASQRVTVFGILLRQLRNPLLILLLAAAGISVLKGDVTDGAIIAAIVVLSVGLGLVNEYRSAKPQPGRMEPVGLDAARGAVGLDAARRAVESAAFELAVRAQALREVTSHVRPGESARPRSSPRCRLVALSSVAMTIRLWLAAERDAKGCPSLMSRGPRESAA